MASDVLAEKVTQRDSDLRSDRTSLEAQWQSIARYVIPRKATFSEEVSTGVDRHRHVLDSPAPRSLELFASFLHTLLNNPSRQWFKMKTVDPDLMKDTSVRQWLEDVEKRMIAEMISPQANLYANLHEVYLDIGSFGTTSLFTDGRGGRLHFRQYHLSTTAFTESADALIDGVYRRFKLKPRQAKRRWPDRELGPSVERADAGEQDVEFIHAVFPIDEEEFAEHLPANVRNAQAAFASVWVNATDRVVVATGFFEEMPYAVPRWYKVRGDLYGRSPAMTVLPDVRMVNRMAETILRGAEKLVDPPIVMPDGQLVSPVRLFSGGITFTDGNVEPKPLLPPGASRIEVGDALLKERQSAIREGFFVPLFVTPDSPVKTARLDIETPVPRHDGSWTTMGEVVPGDVLVGSDGKPVRVTHAHPVMQSREAYEMEFSSGDVVVADDEHRWSAFRSNRTFWRKVSTKELSEDVVDSYGFSLWSIPRVPIIDRTPVKLPLDPYVFGLWLGDGASRDPVITTMDAEIVASLQEWADENDCYVVTRKKAAKGGNRAVDVSVCGNHKHEGCGLKGVLHSIGVLGNKHIPEVYFQGSHEQRLALMQGLMDSDGSSNGRNSLAVWYQRDCDLVDEFVRLVESLGLWPKIYRVDAREDAWQNSVSVVFNAPWPVFRLTRKQAKLFPVQKHMDRQKIVRITPTTNRAMRCITVDAADELYCVGRRYTVTSNTQVLQEVDERNRAVSPMLIRMQTELFQTLILRVFRIMLRAGRLAELPAQLGEGDVDVEYDSPLQASQKQVEALGTLRVVEGLLPWAQIDPGVFDRFDPDAVAEAVHAGSGAPANILRTKRQAEQVRQARAQQQQQQEGLDRLIPAVEAGAKVAQATKDR